MNTKELIGYALLGLCIKEANPNLSGKEIAEKIFGKKVEA